MRWGGRGWEGWDGKRGKDKMRQERREEEGGRGTNTSLNKEYPGQVSARWVYGWFVLGTIPCKCVCVCLKCSLVKGCSRSSPLHFPSYHDHTTALHFMQSPRRWTTDEWTSTASCVEYYNVVAVYTGLSMSTSTPVDTSVARFRLAPIF